jgi:hypothetical protein
MSQVPAMLSFPSEALTEPSVPFNVGQALSPARKRAVRSACPTEHEFSFYRIVSHTGDLGQHTGHSFAEILRSNGAEDTDIERL